MYKKNLFIIIVIVFCSGTATAQYQSYQASSELGLGLGTSTYYGDLNPYGKFTPMRYSFGAYYQKYFTNYIGIKLSGNYIRLYGNDADVNNAAYKAQNLNFSNNLIEVSLAGSFNFFNYAPGFAKHNFTPYISLGVGGIYTNPFTYLNGKKIFLRPLGTEGQNSTTPHDGKKYGRFAMVYPLSFGVRQAIAQKINVFAEIGYRFTSTDYLDDVSTTYAGQNAFNPANYKGSAAQAALAEQLQDRSLNQSVGIQGTQRGNSAEKDSYMLIQIGISYNFNSCNCPGVY